MCRSLLGVRRTTPRRCKYHCRRAEALCRRKWRLCVADAVVTRKKVHKVLNVQEVHKDQEDQGKAATHQRPERQVKTGQ